VLIRGGAAVTLGTRAVAVLATLVGRANEFVSKSAIIEAAWSGLFVEEGNLAVQISAIRRALGRVPGGDGWIETLSRRASARTSNRRRGGAGRSRRAQSPALRQPAGGAAAVVLQERGCRRGKTGKPARPEAASTREIDMRHPVGVARVRFQPDRVGRFDFLCDTFCGEGHEGMSGKIVVSA
jgi:Transcriptional regulatory protein, C terminal